MITQGSNAHPVALNNHFFGPIIKEVHWNSAPIVVVTVEGGFGIFNVQETAQITNDNYANPFAKPGAIAKEAYQGFAKYDPDFTVNLERILNFSVYQVTQDGNRVVTQTYTQYFQNCRRSVLIN